MNNRSLLTTGVVGSVVAATCCATPILAIVLGAFGLTAWLTKADYVLIPVLLICLGTVAFALYRRRAGARVCCEPAAAQTSHTQP